MESMIGPYRIIEPLGQGGMGIVFRACHVGSNQPVALKTVKALAPSWIHGIRREIQALTRIRHPGIVRILDHGVFEERPWYAMDLLEGESLRRFLQRIWSPYVAPRIAASPTELLSATESVPLAGSGAADADLERHEARKAAAAAFGTGGRPPVAAGHLRQVARLGQRVCATLAFLHGEGFINCDLKPENILLVDGEPVIIDFGLSAYHPGGSGRESLEPFPARAGTRPYMSPEQQRGDLVDARSDLYAVGCILYELLVGRPPHRADRLQAPSELVAGVPAPLEKVVMRLLEEEPARRFGYADEAAAALLPFVVDAPKTSMLPTPRPYLYRARFVGRDAFLETLGLLRAAAVRGEGHVVLVGGESGVGKTRLALELARSVPPGEMRTIITEVAPRAMDGGGPPLAAPLHALRPLLLALEERCRAGGPEVTARLLGSRRAALASYEPALAALAPCPGEESEPPVTHAPDAARRRLFRDLAESLAAFAAETPLLWVLDDLGWADELSTAFLASLDRGLLARTPLLILATHRSEEPSGAIDAIARLEHVVSVTLPRLDGSAVQSMAADMLALAEPPAGFVRFIEEQAEGNPFFVAECLRAAIAERVLFRAQGSRWQLTGAFAAAPEKTFRTLALPRPLHALTLQRIHDLSPAARWMALAAAVLGREAELDALHEVAELDEHAGIGALDELLRRQVLELHQSGSVRFTHDKLREVCYADAPPAKRRRLHGRAAAALERRLRRDADPSRIWAALGQHFAAAGEPAAAASYLQRGADHARAIYANADAIRLYDEAAVQAAALAPGAAPAALLREVHEARGDVLALVGRRAEARDAYNEALQPRERTNAAARARLLRKQGRTWETHHEHTEALRVYTEAQAELEIDPAFATDDLRDEWIQVRIDQLWINYWLNQVSEMDALVAVLKPVVERHGSPAQRARFYNTQTLRNLRRDGYFVIPETLQFARTAIDACRPGAPPGEFHMAQVTYGLVLLLAGALEPAQAELTAALAYATRAGDGPQQARCLTYITVASRRRGHLAETAAWVARSAAVSGETGMREYIAATDANGAWVSLRKGDPMSARALAERALSGWKELPAAFPFRWMALVPRLEVALVEADVEEALRCAAALLAAGQQRLPERAERALRASLESARDGSALEVARRLEASVRELAVTHFS